jgi:hypothetical protein
MYIVGEEWSRGILFFLMRKAKISNNQLKISQFVIGIDSYLQNTHYFCATPAAGVAAVMPPLPAGVNLVVVAQPVPLAAGFNYYHNYDHNID